MSDHTPKSCACCGKSFSNNDKRVKTCSRSCAASFAKPLPWLECSKCMASIGLGIKTTAKLLGLPNFGRVASAWNVRGIKKVDPPDGSWNLYARRRGYGPTKGTVRWWGGEEEAVIWVSQQKAKFPDWSCIWFKEKARGAMKTRYASWTDEEKKAWNKACLERRKSDPDQMQKQRQKVRDWKKRNPEKHRGHAKKSVKARKLRDPGFKIACNLRNRFKEIMEVARDPSRKWNSSLIGCDTHRLAAHLESQFTKGITWENYGTHWHVDHIIPCAAFDHTKPEQVRQCWHFTNLRPLEAKKNLEKGAKIEAPQLQLLLTA